jgi:HAD domain in Swiss Army Knife RNA repair proteins
MTGPLLLLLDIDGTLCPVGPGPDGPMRHLSIGAGAVSFRADLPDVLTELAARYELAWATAWQDHANLLLAPALRLPALPVVRFTDPAPDEVGSRYAGHTWKLPSIQRFGADRPLAWIDDDLHGDAYAWAAMRRIPTKLLTTDPSRGITDRHVRALLAFARCTIGRRSQAS